jgi:hypothetical protein
MKINIVLLSLVLCMSLPLFGQESIRWAEPTCGWDSLRSRIQYPEIAVRSGYRTALLASVEIDSSERIRTIYIVPFVMSISGNKRDSLNFLDSVFVHAIVKALHSTKWSSKSINGKKTSSRIEFPFIFYSHTLDDAQRKLMVVDTVRPKLQMELHVR